MALEYPETLDLSFPHPPPTKDWRAHKNVGQFSCGVCAACGYAEWYVADVANLPIDGKTVRVLSEREAEAPYR